MIINTGDAEGDYIVDKIEERLLPSGAKKINLKSKNSLVLSVRNLAAKYEILELCYRNETRMPRVIAKVRPQDPSCEAWYTHMDALCWNVSMSTMRRKSWWMHWVP
jgi:hypothetical protein